MNRCPIMPCENWITSTSRPTDRFFPQTCMALIPARLKFIKFVPTETSDPGGVATRFTVEQEWSFICIDVNHRTVRSNIATYHIPALSKRKARSRVHDISPMTSCKVDFDPCDFVRIYPASATHPENKEAVAGILQRMQSERGRSPSTQRVLVRTLLLPMLAALPRRSGKK